ncbi:uncharacterized protein LOC120113468 [Hibiscus syriacus]|uniref:uncharacterized protein LOC120113468 n=1 Tax=Hibiscus syriacus TaxID=106335 RepID=UPI00192207AC|nr:uncharacterized protein LOC120113468 [Hibiscus syriacus]
MIPGLSEWDSLKVSRIFYHEDAMKILNCPIALVHHDIKVFGWRVFHEAIPDGSKLQAANLDDGICRLHGTAEEICIHALRDCPHIREVLAFTHWDSRILNPSILSGKDWLNYILEFTDKNHFALLLTLLWNIWNRRNKLKHEETHLPPEVVHDYVKLILSDLKSALIQKPAPKAPKINCWKRPPYGSLKLNICCAWFETSRFATIGIIARDQYGLVVGGYTRPSRPFLKVLTLPLKTDENQSSLRTKLVVLFKG